MTACYLEQDYVTAGVVAYYTQYFVLKVEDTKQKPPTQSITTIMDLLDQNDEDQADCVPKKIGDILYETEIAKSVHFWVDIFTFFCEERVQDPSEKMEPWRLLVNIFYRNLCVVKSLLPDEHNLVVSEVAKRLKISGQNLTKVSTKLEELHKIQDANQIYLPGMPFILKPFFKAD